MDGLTFTDSRTVDKQFEHSRDVFELLKSHNIIKSSQKEIKEEEKVDLA